MLMVCTGYRYVFTEDVNMLEVEATLVLSLWSVEALYGEARVRLDAAHALDAAQRMLAVDAGTPVGHALCRLLAGYLQRDVGQDGFRVERLTPTPAGTE